MVHEVCPNCHGNNTEASPDPRCVDDGQGYEWSVTYYFTCLDCGCEFDVDETTTKEITVTKKGAVIE